MIKSKTAWHPHQAKKYCKALSVLKRAVQHRVDEKVFEQHYSYKNMVIGLLDR